MAAALKRIGGVPTSRAQNAREMGHPMSTSEIQIRRSLHDRAFGADAASAAAGACYNSLFSVG